MAREMHPLRWGDPAHAAPLPDATRELVELAFPGTSAPPTHATVRLPEPELPAGLVDSLTDVLGPMHVLTGDDIRRLRVRGKSTPDLLRARAGDLDTAPDAVVRPGSHDQVAAVLDLAVAHRAAVVPFGGGTSVAGGLAPARGGFAGVLSLDLGRLDRLISVDRESMTATLEPGLRGPEAEEALSERGLMLGHYPQSFEYATVGGFAATRSSGQSSAGYGRFDSMVVALRAATPTGDLRLGVAPASAAGPDLRQVLLGSEGTLGVITEVTVRVRELPEVKRYEAWSFPDFASGADTMRRLAQRDDLPQVIRLSDETETAINLASQSEVGGEAVTGCLMVLGHEGTADRIAAHRERTAAALTALGGTPLGEERGAEWAKGRFAAPYLRDSMLDAGVLVETLETATFWSRRQQVYDAVRAALVEELGEGAMVLCHISHVYPTGCSLYFTVSAPLGKEPVKRWLAAKAAATDAMIAHGATITHHHAVGSDHRPWLEAEIGPVGSAMLRGLKQSVDPTGVLNPGILIP